MAININPNRINVQSGSAGKTTDKRRQPFADENSHSPLINPSRAHINHIPDPESLSTLIRSAVAALRKGAFWDRGTIVNLMV